jgi:uncharacterized protein YndB with AHSA1/START domain
MGTIEKNVVINAKADRVVAALTKADDLQKWFPTQAKSDAKAGGKYNYTFIRAGGDNHVVEGKYTQVGRDRVSYTWPMPGLAETSVDWFLKEEGGKTSVRMVHNNIGNGGPWDNVRQMMDPGWGMFVNNLKSYIEGGKDLRKG